MHTRRNFLLAGGAAASLLKAQQDVTFSSDVNVINVFAFVRNKQGKIVSNLGKDDFVLEEDGRRQTIKYFSRETNLPLTLGLLVDTSGSQRRLISEENRASYHFFEQVLREDKDHAFLIHFDREVELLQDMTSSRKKLEEALQSMERTEINTGVYSTQGPPSRRQGGGGRPTMSGQRGGPAGGTMLYDSVLLASEELMAQQKGRKALILLTDGVDTGSKVSLDHCIESAQRSDTLVYSILFADSQSYGGRMGGFGGGMPPFGGGGMGGGRGRGGMGMPPQGRGRERPDGKKVLEQISRETGGSFFQVSSSLPLNEVYNRIEEELRSQYNLGYSPENANTATSGFRRIRLTTRQSDLLVQTRQGYYGKSS